MRRIALYWFLFLVPGLGGHELGHIAGAWLQGGQLVEVAVMPGLTIYPRIARTANTGAVAWVRVQPPEALSGPARLAGAGTTLVMALAAALALLGRRWSGWRWHVLAAFALFHWDMLTYTFLPQWGLCHWVFFGGSDAEPLEGWLEMGGSEVPFEVGVVLASVLCTVALLRKQALPIRKLLSSD